MAETLPSRTGTSAPYCAPIERTVLGIRNLLWGPAGDIKIDIFKRWSQGFYFSKSEPTALEQAQGGPCAVIAPVQAFILKNLLLRFKDLSFREKAFTTEAQNEFLLSALCEILHQCNTCDKYYLVQFVAPECVINNVDTNLPDTDRVENEATKFHENLKVSTFEGLAQVQKHLQENIHQLKDQYGVLIFLYSVIATRGLERVQADNPTDIPEPFIDDTYGYGSQSLINLVITGRATTYVWDHEQDVSGLKLKGLEKQSQIGFITLMEHLRYCTVGSFYKNPMNPVWVVASDTHLSVIFSNERRLVSPETKTEQARRIFKNYDPDGNNFIDSKFLQIVLKELDLVSEEPYVEIMRKKLDQENLGIILLNAFMDEFFPIEENSIPDFFTLVHYNGLPQSNTNGEIKYRVGECALLECDLRAICEWNSMLTVLQTKWPNIEIKWDETDTPSLN